MPADKTIDFVILFVTIGFIVMGLGSLALGWVVKTYDLFMSRVVEAEPRTERANERTNERSSHQLAWDSFLLDKTRRRLIEVMVDSDMTTTDIRSFLKGESKVIGDEVDAARLRLGKPAPDQYRTPIAGRSTSADYYPDEPELAYNPPR